MEGGHAAHSQLEWPTSPEDLPACLDAMKPLLVSTLDLGPNSDYTEKSLIRKMLIVLGEDRWGPQTLDPLPVQQILRWVPDVNKHLTPLRTMTGEQARRRCGYSVPWVSLWACLGQKMAETPAQALLLTQATPTQLLRLLASAEDPEEFCRPGLPWLCEQLMHEVGSRQSCHTARSQRRRRRTA